MDAVRIVILCALSISLSLALPYNRQDKWLSTLKKKNVVKISQGFDSKFSICPDMSQCWGDKVCCRTKGNVKYVCCPGNKPDCCNKDIHDSSEVGVVQFKTVDTQETKDKENHAAIKENAGLECDGIPCANFYTTCCYSDVIHHFYCCNGENSDKLLGDKPNPDIFPQTTTDIAIDAKVGLECDGIPCANFYTTCCYSDLIHHFYCCNGENSEQLDTNKIDTDTKSNEETTEVANVGLECDGIPCANFYTTCCYSDVIHHFYCCNGENNDKMEENIINLDTKSTAKVEKAKDSSENKSIVKGENNIDATNAGLECDGIPCNPNVFHSCCYSDVIRHWYCC